MGISFSVRPVDQQRRQLAVSFYSRWYYVRSGVGVSARRIRSAIDFIPSRSKFLEQKLSYLKNPKKCFFAQKLNLENTFYGGGDDNVFPNL